MRSIIRRSLIFAGLGALLASPVSATVGLRQSPLVRDRVSLPNVDIRSNSDILPSLHLPLNGMTPAAPRMKALQDSMASATAALAVQIPAIVVVPSRVLGSPPILGTANVGTFLTPPLAEDHEAIVRGFLSRNAAVYGLAPDEVAGLVKTADYANPAGNLSWVQFRQEKNGIPVFQSTIRAALTRSGEIARTTGLLAPGLDASALPTRPVLSPTAAVTAASKAVGVTVDPSRLTVTPSIGASSSVVTGTPFDEEVRPELVYFPLGPGQAVLAYSMVLWEDVDAYYVLVDAATGGLLWRKNITCEQSQAATYSVYNDDSPTPLSPSTAVPGAPIQPPAIGRTALTLISELPAFDNLGWLTDGANVTTGNNVDAGLDIDGVNGIDPNGRAIGNPSRTFSFSYTPGGQTGATAPSDPSYRMGSVTNLFFWSNRYHDRLYQLGFTEAAGNFQDNNFGRGGLGADYVRAEVQDSGGTNNANFATPPDGSKPRMQMYIWTSPSPARDGSLDADVFLHELTHGLSGRLHADASGLGTTQSGGLGEGWSDFYARCLLATADEDVNGVYAAAAYSVRDLGGLGTNNYYYGIRRFPYALITSLGPNGKPYNPTTFADMDPALINLSDGAFPRSPAIGGTATEVHNIGSIWCAMLLEVRARIINRLGFDAGNQRVLQIVTDAMKLDPANPTLLQARDSILAADAAGFGGADEDDIWAGFAARGIGTTAALSNAATVVEGFDTNLPLTLTGAAEGIGNGNGFFDPGETVTLTLALNNPYTAKAVTAVTASVAGGSAIAFGDLGPEATASQQAAYTIPATTACGTRLSIPVSINSSLGPVTRNVVITVGKPLFGFTEGFDAVTVPALPSGWATTHSATQPAWTTTTSNVFSSPNCASFTPVDGGPTVDISGESSIFSPPIAISTAAATVSFKNAYNMEDGFDGMALEMSVDGGVYSDVLFSGGVIVTGGYTDIAYTGSGSPLSGRAIWMGLSAGSRTAPGYVTTIVSLPASLKGHTVQFRWRVAVDHDTNAPGLPGVWIDDIAVSDATQCSVFATPFVRADISAALMIASGLQTATAADRSRLDLVAGASAGVVDMLDATEIARKVAGLDPNP